MVNKRQHQSFLDRMAEALNPGPSRPSEISPVTGPPEPPRETTSYKEVMIDRVARQNRAETAPRVVHQDKTVFLGSDRPSLPFRSYTPDSVLDGIRSDPQMLERARQWSGPGGNDFAALVFERYMRSEYGIAVSSRFDKIIGSEYGKYEDYNDFFDWDQWREDYEASK